MNSKVISFSGVMIVVVLFFASGHMIGDQQVFALGGYGGHGGYGGYGGHGFSHGYGLGYSTAQDTATAQAILSSHVEVDHTVSSMDKSYVLRHRLGLDLFSFKSYYYSKINTGSLHCHY